MVMERDWFVFYKSFITGIDTIPDAAEQLKAYKYIIRYWIFWECPEEENSIAYGFFSMAKPQIDANNKRFANGKKWWQFWHLWWAPEWNQNAVKSWNNLQNNPNGVEQNNPKTTPKEKEKEKEKEKDIKEKNKKEKWDIGSASIDATPIDNESSRKGKNKKYDIQSIIHTDNETLEEREALDIARNAYKEMRKKIKKPLTEYAEKLRANDLNKLWKTVEEKIAVLNQSIASWWQDLYEVKQRPISKPITVGDWKVISKWWYNFYL